MTNVDPHEGTIRAPDHTQCGFCRSELTGLVDPDDPFGPDSFEEAGPSQEYRDKFYRTPDGTKITRENFPDADMVCYSCGRSWPVSEDDWFPTIATSDMLIIRDDGEINEIQAVDSDDIDEVGRGLLQPVNKDVAPEWVSHNVINERFIPVEWR